MLNRNKYLLKLRIILLILCSGLNIALAQKLNSTLYFMDDVPQRNKLNPAFQGNCNLFIGFPGLNSIYLNYTNNSFAYKDIVVDEFNLNDDTTKLNSSKFLGSLANLTRLTQQVEVTWFTAGYKHKDYYFNFEVADIEQIHTSVSKNIFSLLINGVGDNTNERLYPIRGSGLYYREYAFGISKNLNNGFFIGVKLKFLFGKANLHVDKTDAVISSSLTDNYVRLSFNQTIRSSLPIREFFYNINGTLRDIDVESDDIFKKSFFFNNKNRGYGFDIGAIYNSPYNYRLHASIINLGYITWKKDVNSFHQNKNYQWDIVDFPNLKNTGSVDVDDISEIFETLSDSIRYNYNVDTTFEKYNTGLPTQIYLGADFILNENITLGGLLRTEIFQSQIIPAITLASHIKVSPSFNITGSYTYHNRASNIGLGISKKIDFLQFYIVSDNFLSPLWRKNLRNANIRLGINMNFCFKKKINDCDYEYNNYRKPLRSNKRKKRWGIF